MRWRNVGFSLTLAAVLIAPLRIQAQELTVGVDGEVWVQLDTTQLGKALKLYLLKGIYEGIVWGRSPDMSKFATNVSSETLVDGLDKFYVDPANRKILVVWALEVFARQLAGVPQASVDTVVAFYRCEGSIIAPNLTAQQWRDRIAKCGRSTTRQH